MSRLTTATLNCYRMEKDVLWSLPKYSICIVFCYLQSCVWYGVKPRVLLLGKRRNQNQRLLQQINRQTNRVVWPVEPYMENAKWHFFFRFWFSNKGDLLWGWCFRVVNLWQWRSVRRIRRRWMVNFTSQVPGIDLVSGFLLHLMVIFLLSEFYSERLE